MPISLKQAEDIIVHAPEQDCVVLVSPPGTGKSSAAVRAAIRMGARYMPVYAATMEAVDARGLPYVHSIAEAVRRVGWAAPSFLPLEMDAAAHAKEYGDAPVLVNFDDWFQAPPPVLRATVRSIYGDGSERRIGDFPVLKQTRFIATGNREQDRAGVYRPETYVNDRITYVEVEPNVDDYCQHAMGGFAMPARDESYGDKRRAINKAVALGIPDELIAFVKWSSQVYEFSPEARSFLSPRSIERLGRFVRAFDAAGINGDMLHEVACGTIGESQAVKFMALRKLRNELPNTAAILRGEDVPLPPKTEILYILVTTILRAAKKEHLPAVAKLLTNMSQCKAPAGMIVGVEPSAYLASQALRGESNKELCELRARPEFLKWLEKNGKYFIS